MTLAVTLMIRDEADILPAWLDHHVAQGFDVFVITDNRSVDGSTALLEAFAARTDVVVDLRHDPVHRKQQASVVTQMARDAAAVHAADWVVNADADEFLVPVDRTRTLAEVFAALDPAIGAFTVPVVNMVGPLATSGTGLGRLRWRDERSDEQLRAVGLIAQPSSNAVHVGDPDVTVVQGNHQVSVANGAPVPEALRLEVLHLPWRSLAQYRRRVEASGRAYTVNPALTPSPNHHGMRDYRRLQAGTLDAYYALRHVNDAQAAAGPFTEDTTVTAFLAGRGLRPATVPDVLVPPEEAHGLQLLGTALLDRDRVIDDQRQALAAIHEDVRLLQGTIRHLEARLAEEEQAHEAFRQRRAVRLATQVADHLGRGR